jgi:2'-5' RNA ligase
VTGLDALARLVRAGTVPIVPIAAGGESPFVGHLTLGRARGRIDRSTRLGLEGIPFGATWTLSSIDLVASHRTPAGTRYTTLGRFPLRVRPGRALPGRDEPS